MQDQLAKLSSHELTIYTKLRSEVKDRPESAYENRFDESMDILHRIQDGDNYLKSVENLLWLPDLPEAFTQLVRLVSQHRLKHCIKSVVVYTDQEYDEYDFSIVDELLNNAVEEFWSQVFSLAEPRRIVVVAPPSTMTGLLDTSIMCFGAWANLSAEFHYVELLQSEPLPPEHRATSCRPGDSMIIHRRPWYHLGFNTGWSYHRLGMYDNVLDCSPEVFYGILSCFTDKAQDCCTITSFDFTSVFPTDDYIDRLISTLLCIPTLRHISIQLAPGLEDDRFIGGNHRDRRQYNKFWYVWQWGHDTLAGQLRDLEFPDGLVFCSRDHEVEHLEVGREVGIAYLVTIKL